MLDLVEEVFEVADVCWGWFAPPFPLGEATGVVVLEVFMIFSGGLGDEEDIGSALASAASSEARKLKKVQAKKLVKSNKKNKNLRDIAFLVDLNFFPVQK